MAKNYININGRNFNFERQPDGTFNFKDDSARATTTNLEKDKNNIVNNIIKQGLTVLVLPGWYVGTLSTTTGDLGTATNRLRVIDFTSVSGNTFVVKVDEGYSIAVFKYDGNRAFVTWSGWKTGEYVHTNDSAYFKIILKKNDDSALSLEDAAHVQTFEYFDSIVNQVRIIANGNKTYQIELDNNGIPTFKKSGGTITVKIPNSTLYCMDHTGTKVGQTGSYKNQEFALTHEKVLLWNLTDTYNVNTITIQGVTEARSEKSIVLAFVANGQIVGGHWKTEYDLWYNLQYCKDNNPNIVSTSRLGNALAPEHTPDAYIASKKAGFKYASGDVSFTSDGVPVMIHDSTANRTGRQWVGKAALSGTVTITATTYQTLYDTIDFGIYKGAAYTDRHIMKFDEWIKLMKKLGMVALVEQKEGWTQALVEGLVDTVASLGMLNNVYWMAANTTSLTWIADKYATYGAKAKCLLFCYYINATTVTSLTTLKTKADVVAFFDKGFATHASTNMTAYTDIITNGIPAWAFTFDDEAELITFAQTYPYISGYTSCYHIAGNVIAGSI